MTEIPGGDPPTCDACNKPIVGPVFRVGVERFCKNCKEQTVMAWPKPTLEDFRLKTEGTDLCWIAGCDESQRKRGLCKKHYDRARHNGFLTEVVAQIEARSEAPMPLEQVKAVVCKPLPGMEIAEGDPIFLGATVGCNFRPAVDPLEWRIQELEAELSEVRGALVAAIGESDDRTTLLEKVAALVMQRDSYARIAEEARKSLQYAHREAGAEAELRALRAALADVVGAHPEPLTSLQQVALLKDREYRAECAAERQSEEMGIAIASVRRLADELTAVDQALGPYRLEAAQGNRVLAIEALAAPSGPVLLSEANLRERFSRLNEIGHAESLIAGLSDPLHAVLWTALEAEKARILRVCP